VSNEQDAGADVPSEAEGQPTESGESSEQAAPDAEGEPARAAFRLRRAPRYRPFGLTGVLLGVVGGVVLALSFPAQADYSMQTIAGYFAAIFGLVGGLLGLGLAVLIERRRP
jgi:hypothetical protein